MCDGASARTWWKEVGTQKKLFLSVLVSMLIGTSDTAMDIVVVTQWYSDPDIWWGFPTVIVSCIVIPALFTFSLFYGQWTLLISEPKWLFFVVFASFIGFSNFAFGIYWLAHPEDTFSNNRIFRLSRVMEIFIEAAPAGAIQLYVLIKDGIYELNVNTMSICASIFSISFGLEEALAQSFPLFDRLCILLFSLFDFLFRVSSTSIFLNEFPDAHWILVPVIYIFEVIVIFSVTSKNDNHSYKLKSLMALLWAIPMVVTAGPFFALQNSSNEIRLFEFTFRFILSVVLSGMSISKNIGTELWILVIPAVGTILSSCRMGYILLKDDHELSIYGADKHKLPANETN